MNAMMTTHELALEATTDPWERAAGQNYFGECSCSNPDGYGDGGMTFFGATRDEVEEQWEYHCVKAGGDL